MITKEEVLSILKTHPNGNIEEINFKRKFPERFDEHVAFVTNEDLAFEFCEKHKDCYYYPVHITKYL